MTSATTKAAGNGTSASPADKPREIGLASLREEELHHLTQLAETACMTTERLLRQVSSDAFRCVVSRDGTAQIDWAKSRQVLDEAYACAALALTYIYDAWNKAGVTPGNVGLTDLTPTDI